jgi:hypothetical protein
LWQKTSRWSLFKRFLQFLLIIFVIAGCTSDYKDINKCESLGTFELICDLQNPEDFAKIPGENSIVVSQFAGLPELNQGKTLIGKLSKLNLETNEVQDFEIEFLETNDLGIGEEGCQPYEEFYPHGIDIFEHVKLSGNNLSPLLEEAALLAVVNHEKRSRVEFFLLFPVFVNLSDVIKPTLFWIGCATGPEETTYFNDVVVYDHAGSFFSTHQYDKNLGFNYLFLMNIFRFNTGHVYNWTFKDGFSVLKNSEGAWPNGIDMIGDDLYVNYRMNGKISRFSKGEKKDLVLRTYLNGGPDNVTAVGDELWIGGQNTDLGGIYCIDEAIIQCPMPFFVIRADKDLNILEEYNFKDVAYGGASVAYPFKDKVFVGAYKSDRIGIFKR